MSVQRLSARHFMWVGLASWQAYALYKDMPAASWRQQRVGPVEVLASDEEVAGDDARVARLRSLLGAVGADLTQVSELRLRVTERQNVVATNYRVDAPHSLLVTVSRTYVDQLVDDEHADFAAQLRTAALTGRAPMTVAQSNAALAPPLQHFALRQHAAGQLQHTLMLALPPVFGLLLRRRFPAAHDQSILISNLSYLLCMLTVEQAWFPRVRIRRCISTLGPAYVDAALEAAELERAVNRHTRAELLRTAKAERWSERVPARFRAMLYTRNGNYWGDFGLRTTTAIRWLNESKAKAAA